jgi:hypothetical protein
MPPNKRFEREAPKDQSAGIPALQHAPDLMAILRAMGRL